MKADVNPKPIAQGIEKGSVLLAVENVSLSFGGVTRPGPGFLPTCLALALTLVAAAVLFRAVVGSTDGWADSTRRGRTRAAITLAALLGYTLILERIGFGVATAALIAFLLRAVEPQRWSVALGGAAATALVSHLLFRVWLGVRLPVGPWGF